MNEGDQQNDASNGENISLMPMSERLTQAVSLIDSNPSEALHLLTRLQQDVESVSLFSSNESLEDISSRSLPLLALNHFLATATMALPTGLGQSKQRLAHVRHGTDLWSIFLQKLEDLELLSDEQKSDLHVLLESNDGDDHDDNGSSAPRLPPPISRDVKIARFRAKQQIQNEIARLQSLQQRRQRLQTRDVDEMDGYDQESLERTLAITALQMYASDALDEWSQALRELPMIEQMIKMEQSRPSNNMSQQHAAQQQRPPTKPLEVTHITQDSTTGQLLVRREQVQSQVFRPGWNQPTMSLEELGEMEVHEALEREERQRQQEALRKDQPKRYEDLVKEGMDDNAELVDASAVLDRAWDDWKDANPRGSGNKMGDRGDRNM